MRPSEPQVGRATRQHDSRQVRVVWQCFRLVRTCAWEEKRRSYDSAYHDGADLMGGEKIHEPLPVRRSAVSFGMWSCKRCRPTHKLVRLGAH